MSDFPWTKVDPDSGVDLLPQPYRSINKIVEDVLSAVGDRIGELENQRKSEAYEVGLRHTLPTTCIPVAGRVTCSQVDARCLSRLVLGTSGGEVLVIDTRSQTIVAQKRVFSDAVSCVASASDGVYRAFPAGPSQGGADVMRPHSKVFVAGASATEILVYDAWKDEFGGALLSLKPACVLQLPPPPAEDSSDQGTPAVVELHAKGTGGAIWVVALLSDRRLFAYWCPLGEPEAVVEDSNVSVTQQVIQEDDENEEEERPKSAPSAEEEFRTCLRVRTPAYSLSLPCFALPGLPEPPASALRLTICMVQPQHGSSAFGVPLVCFVSSAHSNCVAAYSLQGPQPHTAPAGLTLDEFLQKTAPTPGEAPEPTETVVAAVRRLWSLPAKTSAVAASPTGSLFAAAGASGSIAIVNTAFGPSLGSMLPGHYAAVAALAFHHAEVLVSVGADSWVHHYCVKTDTLLFRYLCSPPPSPPPAASIAVSQTMPLAFVMDTAGQLRLLDVRRGRKIARPVCFVEGVEEECFQEGGGYSPPESPIGDRGTVSLEEPIGPNQSEQPRQVLACSSGFIVLCCSSDGTVAVNPPATEEHHTDGIRSWLAYFDQAALLRKLFPGLAARIDPVGEDRMLMKMFSSFSLEELSVARDRGPEPEPDETRSRSHGTASHRGSVRSALRHHESGASMATEVHSIASTVSRKSVGQHPHFSEVPDVRLTEENLKHMSPLPTPPSMGHSVGRVTSLASTVNKSSVAPSEDVAKILFFAAQEGHAHSEHWQANARKCLGATLKEKDRTHRRIAKRIDLLKKELRDT